MRKLLVFTAILLLAGLAFADTPSDRLQKAGQVTTGPAGCGGIAMTAVTGSGLGTDSPSGAGGNGGSAMTGSGSVVKALSSAGSGSTARSPSSSGSSVSTGALAGPVGS